MDEMTVFIEFLVSMGIIFFVLHPLISRKVPVRSLVSAGVRSQRAELEEKKNLVLREIKDVEFDFKMGKLSQEDYDELSAKFRKEGMEVIKELETITSPRDTAKKGARQDKTQKKTGASKCPSCGADVSGGAKFCRSCGKRVN